MAQKYFVETKRTTVVLAHKEKARMRASNSSVILIAIILVFR